ncbi:MAG TPA: hypothetical protein VIL78_00655 [Hanamia sp.]
MFLLTRNNNLLTPVQEVVDINAAVAAYAAAHPSPIPRLFVCNNTGVDQHYKIMSASGLVLLYAFTVPAYFNIGFDAAAYRGCKLLFGAGNAGAFSLFGAGYMDDSTENVLENSVFTAPAEGVFILNIGVAVGEPNSQNIVVVCQPYIAPPVKNIYIGSLPAHKWFECRDPTTGLRIVNGEDFLLVGDSLLGGMPAVNICYLDDIAVSPVAFAYTVLKVGGAGGGLRVVGQMAAGVYLNLPLAYTAGLLAYDYYVLLTPFI